MEAHINEGAGVSLCHQTALYLRVGRIAWTSRSLQRRFSGVSLEAIGSVSLASWLTLAVGWEFIQPRENS